MQCPMERILQFLNKYWPYLIYAFIYILFCLFCVTQIQILLRDDENEKSRNNQQIYKSKKTSKHKNIIHLNEKILNEGETFEFDTKICKKTEECFLYDMSSSSKKYLLSELEMVNASFKILDSLINIRKMFRNEPSIFNKINELFITNNTHQLEFLRKARELDLNELSRFLSIISKSLSIEKLIRIIVAALLFLSENSTEKNIRDFIDGCFRIEYFLTINYEDKSVETINHTDYGENICIEYSMKRINLRNFMLKKYQDLLYKPVEFDIFEITKFPRYLFVKFDQSIYDMLTKSSDYRNYIYRICKNSVLKPEYFITGFVTITKTCNIRYFKMNANKVQYFTDTSCGEISIDIFKDYCAKNQEMETLLILEKIKISLV